MVVRVEKNAEPIPGYRLIERLGGGGFGEVWRAEAPGGFHKAIKFVYGDLSASGETDQRAKQELKALDRVRSVRHPYILSLERYEVIDGQLLIVMELADRNLWDRYKECRAQGLPGIPREELLRYMTECAEALDLMNQEYQLQHLDIKPQNLFLIHNHVKIADFGLVKDMEGSQASVTGGITPVYAAPETFDGRVTRFSDQYSLAIVYQELLTGQRPFNGSNVRQLILQHISASPNVAPLPADDRPHVQRALCKIPEQRFPSCQEFVAALRGAGQSQTASIALAVAPSQLVGGSPAVGSSPATTPNPLPSSWQGMVAAPPSSGPVTANLRRSVPETGSSQGITHSVRPSEQAILSGQPVPSTSLPRTLAGTGTLFPALIIGLGQIGQIVLQRLREQLHTTVAPLTQLSNLRFLLLDTDPEVMRTATRGLPGASLSASEVLLAPLNRPSYYLKPRDGRLPIDNWLNQRLLYCIPRSQVTTGIRALGRLAFCDNYRAILRRLQLELEALLDPNALQNAIQFTGRGLRSNRPRIYLVSSLAGGTGSGMFIDLAYTLRALLKQMGYENPDVVGLLLLPCLDSNRSRGLHIGNTYAALSELEYFGSPEHVFQGRYHEREAAIVDPEPPLSRIILLPLPDESDEAACGVTFERCGQFLSRDLTTNLGRTADLCRAGLPPPTWETRGQYFQTFNFSLLSCPRPALFDAIARRLCQQLVQHWASKDSKPLRESVQHWLQQQWKELELGADCFITRTRHELVGLLGKDPDLLFQDILEPIRRFSWSGDKLRPRADLQRPAHEMLETILAELDEQLGNPAAECLPEQPPRLIVLLRQATEKLANDWSQKLAEMAVCLIEEPAFRLAGAEEAIRQMVATIEQVLQHHEPLIRSLSEKATAAHQHIRTFINQLKQGQRRTTLLPAEFEDILRTYPKWRYQSLVLQQVSAAFVGLRGHLSDQLREVNFCRVRLGELSNLLEQPIGAERALITRSDQHTSSFAQQLFGESCVNFAQAIDQYLQQFQAEQLLELDTRLEAMLRTQFTALVHVCLTNDNILPQVHYSLLAVARDYVSEKLPIASVAELFFAERPDEEQVDNELRDLFEKAAPEIAGSRSFRGGPPPMDLCLLLTPTDEMSLYFRQRLTHALEDVEITTADSPDDILLYRERNNLALKDVEHFGTSAHKVYVQMIANENFTPHARMDIDFRPQ
jgi:serine/threonine protein kinase